MNIFTIVTLTVSALFAPSRSPESVVSQWNEIAVRAAVVADRTQAVSTIEVTIVQTAVYDAVRRAGAASVDAAVATAAHAVLVWLYPSQAAELDARLTATLRDVPDGPSSAAGRRAGAAAAAAAIAMRAADGRDDPARTFTPQSGIGAWQPTPPGFLAAQTPWVAHVRPFTMTSPSQFRPGPPPSIGSDRYARDFAEVARLGAADGSSRAARETATALFWDDHYTVQHNRYLRRLASERQLPVEDTARLLAHVNVAVADAFIACMDAKYAYAAWRPVMAISAAASDDNPATTAAHGWRSLIATPNHPEYPSAHACGSAASTSMLAHFFGRADVTSTVTSTVAGSGGPRTFGSFGELYADVHEARILAGLHFRFSMDAGREIGRRVAEHAARALTRTSRPVTTAR